MRQVLFRATLIALSLFSAAASAAAFKAGEHYTVIAEQPSSEAVVMEFFSYGCGACSAFNPIIQQTRRVLGEQVSFKHVPVDFGSGFWTPTQDLFLVLEAMGRREELHTAAFAHFFGEPPHPKTEAGVKAFLARHGIAAEQFEKTRASFAVHVKEKRYDQLTKQYRISTTPTIIVNGKYRVEHSAVNSAQEFVQLVRFLLQNP